MGHGGHDAVRRGAWVQQEAFKTSTVMLDRGNPAAIGSFFRRIVDAFRVMQDLLRQKYCDGRNLPKVAYGFKKIRRIQTSVFAQWDGISSTNSVLGLR